jgi:hypothetical protein
MPIHNPATTEENRAMNLEQLKRNIGWRVQLAPPAIYLDALGRELPHRGEEWIIKDVNATEVKLDEASILGLGTVLGPDVVHRFDTNRSLGAQHGFLVLSQQMFIQQNKITFQPCPRPGERVPPPPPVTITEQWVNSDFPNTTGLTKELEAAGYRVSWVNVSRLAELEIAGWEKVIAKDRYGMPSSLYVKTNPENMVLVKTSKPDLSQLVDNAAWKNRPGLVSCTVSSDGDALVFVFNDPVSAYSFFMHMNMDPSVIRCAMAPGRVDTVMGRLTEDGVRMLKRFKS